MASQICQEGHEIRLPYYGPLPSCPDCADLVREYAGVAEDEDDDADELFSEDDELDDDDEELLED